MPKIIKKKAPKKKVVQEDEVKSAAFQALDVIKDKQKEIIIGVASVAAVVLLFMIISFYSTSQYKKAGEIQVDADSYYYGTKNAETPAEERLKKAVELYEQSLDIQETPLALFYLGNAYFKLGNFENAKKEYTRFIDEFSGDELIEPLVYQKLVSVYFKLNDTDNALATMQKLSSLNNGIFKDTALILEARYYDGTGETEKAMSLYQQIVDTYDTSPWSAEAASKIAAAKKDVEEASQPEDNNETDTSDTTVTETPEDKSEAAPQAEKRK